MQVSHLSFTAFAKGEGVLRLLVGLQPTQTRWVGFPLMSEKNSRDVIKTSSLSFGFMKLNMEKCHDLLMHNTVDGSQNAANHQS